MIFVVSKVSGHCGVVIVFYFKDMTLESVYDSVLSLSYFVWHQLHSIQYIKLLLWQVPFIIVL